jgi:hypothetical protein
MCLSKSSWTRKRRRVPASLPQIRWIDRAWGRPPQFISGDERRFRRANEMSDDELARIAQTGPRMIELVVDNKAEGSGPEG